MSAGALVFCENCQSTNRVPLAGPTGKAPICGRCKNSLTVHGGVAELSAQGLQKFVAKSSFPIVVDFWAPWCGPCRVFAPVFESAAQMYAGQIAFVKVNTEAHPSASTAYQIRGIPCLLLFKNGAELARQSGALPLADLQRFLAKVT